ncbi:Protein of unknown function DUF262 [Capnocytophaga granulosa]|uniref:GmrSD restriction endonucleases N-terminal domain-containing protein n=1 Tax=Capnocytophaga granulosa TaxID=45242 RepID=A0A1H2T4B7_9FLAO|nr:DUF262 domain-containing protein [Capnocytophaga granulosa]EPD29211.1 hypothetical protein HMPREF9331_01357 [Capnocytophaga granulosa ATCC 51502]SDW38084.1 Protein of unknown function DUF262 [Capnocytophaga granulosa]SUX15294.1 Protein of uncharacterised function DUF262 [Capnocytophaga granulosa]
MSNKTTFLSFAQNKKIEIPIFQRDYAQGRNDETTDKIRKDFVSSLIEALDKNIPIELDFIYGREVDNSITLIDGQQRLTTLFLLHWYISQRIGKIDAFKNIKFSYATRDYAKDFTAKLTTGEDFKIDFTQAILSTELKDKNWFYDDWQHDPTVSGMLNTLDEIHKQLKDKTIDHYWSLLEQGIITFYWLDLEKHQLTDELYLKMNARGKQLSKFENFKASLTKRIADEQWEKGKAFSLKMDTAYTDLFWKYRGNVNVIDYEVTNFFAGMAMIGYALKEKNSEAQQRRVQELFNNPLSVRVEDFEESDFNLFMSYLNFYSTVENISIETNLWKYYNTDNKRGFFEEFIKDENKGTGEVYKGATYPQRIFFYALSELFIKVKDQASRENFIRVVRNIVENVTIDSAQTFIGAIRLMNEFLEGMQDIYSYLSKTAIQSNFASYQVAQEIDKAKRIVADSQWKGAIWEAEDHSMFKGDIGFLLLETENNLDLFKKRYEVAKEMFDENGVKGKYRENALLLRALISRLDHWSLVWNLNFDSSKDNWKAYILKTIYKEKENRITKHFLTLLDNENKLEVFITEEPSLEKNNENIELYKKTLKNLYQTELLVAICEKCYLRWESENYILYPYNGRKEQFKYIVTHERNSKLAKAIEEGIITTEQQLEVNGKKIPFFWGWNVSFIYNNEEYWYYYNTDKTKITKNGQDCTEEALQKIFSSSL